MIALFCTLAGCGDGDAGAAGNLAANREPRIGIGPGRSTSPALRDRLPLTGTCPCPARLPMQRAAPEARRRPARAAGYS